MASEFKKTICVNASDHLFVERLLLRLGRHWKEGAEAAVEKARQAMASP
jgi:hypothetical protein